ncbi:MAG: calcium-translocating P-type ATPase, PMCA-type [Gemmataceae bacterium]
MNTLQEIVALFPDCKTKGLSSAQAETSRKRFGANHLTPIPSVPIWLRFLEKFDEAIIKILLAAAILSFFIELFQASELIYGWIGLATLIILFLPAFIHTKTRHIAPAGLAFFSFPLILLGIISGHTPIEGIAVMVAVILATGVAFLSEWKSDREFEKLNQNRQNIRVKVYRDGTVRNTTLDEIVAGDLIVLATGDELPADGIVLQANSLEIDQSLLTGESEPVEKSPFTENQPSMDPMNPFSVFRGTQVISGTGTFLVLATGDTTMIGTIASHLGSEKTPSDTSLESRLLGKLSSHQATTPLQEKLEVLAGQISNAGYIAAVAIFLTLVVRGTWFTTPAEIFLPANSTELFEVFHKLLRYLMYMVIIIVVAVPEGLPMSVTISLALAMRKMTRANSLVRQLVACETIGSATIICTDKTGTLTLNRMTVEKIISGDGTIHSLGSQPFKPMASENGTIPIHPTEWMTLNAGLNSTAHLDSNGAGLGNSTEAALLVWLNQHGVDYRKLREKTNIMGQNSFSSERKWMDTTIQIMESSFRLVKGAPEIILAECQHYMASDGMIKPITPKERALLENVIFALASQGNRILGTAFEDTSLKNIEIGRLVLTGFYAIRDPLRSDVKEAIAACQDGGIQILMITGDNPNTAVAIAKEAGLLKNPEHEVLTSSSMAQMTDMELSEKLAQTHVLARAKPLDKYRVIRLLQEKGHVVAVTGDGTNDAPALKKADVGLAMGISGTEVAKEASKIVILDDSFSTIVKAVLWGRSLYENIQRFLQFQLTINLSALIIAFIGPLIGIRPPFTILQLLWINVIMDSFAAIALCSEEPDPNLLKLPPKKRNESILSRAMLWNIATTGLFMVVVMIALLLGMKHFHWLSGDQLPNTAWEFAPLNEHQISMFFSGYVLMQVWNMINCRSLRPGQGVFRGILRNKAFLAIMATIVVVQLLIVQTGYKTFMVTPLGLFDWLAILVCSSVILAFGYLNRFLQKVFLKSP